MGTIVDMSMSLDGFVAGPSPSLEQPLGEGGDRLHEWAVGLEAFRERHGQDGGEASADSERIRKTFDSIGAFVMGRRMYSGGEGPWDADPEADGWWGDDPPFRAPVFVLTHHARERAAKQGVDLVHVRRGRRRERDSPGARDSGGQERRRRRGRRRHPAGAPGRLVDELRLHLALVLLGGYDGFRRPGDLELERRRRWITRRDAPDVPRRQRGGGGEGGGGRGGGGEGRGQGGRAGSASVRIDVMSWGSWPPPSGWCTGRTPPAPDSTRNTCGLRRISLRDHCSTDPRGAARGSRLKAGRPRAVPRALPSPVRPGPRPARSACPPRRARPPSARGCSCWSSTHGPTFRPLAPTSPVDDPDVGPGCIGRAAAAYIAQGVGRIYAAEYKLPSTTFTRVRTSARRARGR